MKIFIDPEIKKAVVSAEKQTGFPCYVVGGYIRNHILGKTSDDIDFVVEGDSILFAEKFAMIIGRKKVVKFPRFKTAKVNCRSISVEFVSARSETYSSDSRNPTVQDSSLHNDLMRRDFTINSLAARITESEDYTVIDHFGGSEDLRNGIIRTPIDPFETYRDDPLRMFRAVRFAAVLDFKIEKPSFEAICANLDRIGILSSERISDEFFKIMSSKNPVKGVWLMYRSKLLGKVFPELTGLTGIEEKEGVRHKDIFIHTLKVLYNISKTTENPALRIAALFHDIGKVKVKYFKKGTGWTFHGHDERGSEMFRSIADRMKFSNEIKEYVSKIIRLHHRPISLAKEEVTDSGVRRLLFEGGCEVEDLMTLCRADITTANAAKLNRYLANFDSLSRKIVEVEEKDRLRNFKPPVTGEDIMYMFGIEAGPEVGRIKNIVVEAVLNGEIENSRPGAMELLKNLKN